ncbi:putative short-chain dehydrogenase/reductase [Actinoplanes ianthinogenes]|uniref:Short-chain dehydrogenase/reductase n=1 Tax=Actinoplanes ianthinogenes TaxID=122358 RepID=A0ABN6CPL9_9ACTN|nr:SDR family NAD(P)-dependent oxidoreductase [Actinoplanes ianthinogenes]BCJ47137.1 putative short-chain dehydrogenase/reductase [Actinoplanes ianthinogenes]GGR51954.1 putative short-chain dehydrogenase/reductase [Actinoplanes ianthinogenes]
MKDKVAVITGAGSGIGRALALELARRGARLALSDVNDAGLAETADQVKALGAEVHTAHLDVTDRAAVEAYASTVAAHYGVVHQVYNNAGISGGGRTILDSDWAAIDQTLAVNLFGVIHGTKAFLPHLIASGDGHVVNISSLNGIMAQPTLGAYCASKFGVRGFTEVLRTEMINGGHPVKVTVVHPGGVKTDIASATLRMAQTEGYEVSATEKNRMRVYNEKLLKMPADQAARIIADGVQKGAPRVRVGNDAKMADRLVRFLPRYYPKFVVNLERRLFGKA